MAYVPPSGGNIVVEISTAQGYVPPSASSIVVDLATEDGGGGSGVTSFVSANGALVLTPQHEIRAVIGHTMPVAGLLLTGYPPTHAATSTSVISSTGTLTLAPSVLGYAASNTVGAGALTLTPQQPVYFMGYTQSIQEQGALTLSAGGVAAQACANQISLAGLLLSGQEISASAVTAVTDTAALTLAGLPVAGEKRVIHAEVEATYFYPDVTLDDCGSLTLTGYPPGITIHIYAEVEGYSGLMARVAAEVVGVYTARVVSSVDAGYALREQVAVGLVSEYRIADKDRVVASVISGYRFPIVADYESFYSLLTTVPVRAALESSFSLIQTQVIRSAIEAPYSALTNIPVSNAVEGQYNYQEIVRRAVEAAFSLTVPLAAGVEVAYTIEGVAKARAGVESFYSMPAAQVIAINVPPYIEYQGRVLDIEEAEVSIAEGDYAWTCTAILTRTSDYAQLRLDQPFALVIGADRYEFLVDGKELDRTKPANFGMKLTGVSPSASMATPRRQSSSYTWDTVVSASEIAEELLPGVDWQVVDWTIPAYRFAIQDATPVESVQVLAEAIGAVLESEIDGSLYVRSKYPVSVPLYDATAPVHVFVEATDIISVSESYVSSDRFNRLIVTDIEQDVSDSLEWIPDYDDAVTGIVRAYLYPWRSAVDLLHTGVGSVSIKTPVTGMEQHDETIEVFQGQANTSYPIHHVESIEYEAQNTGGILFDPDSRAFTVGGPSFNSVIRLVYWTRSLDYRVALPDARPTQFLLESDPL